MNKGVRSTTAFCYLYKEIAHAYELTRLSPREVAGSFPHPLTRELQDVRLPFDERDRRTLLVFDGDVPWCGVSRHADQIYSEKYTIVTRPGRDRKQRSFEESRPQSLKDSDGFIQLTLTRRYLLVRSGMSVLRRYLDDSLSGRYVVCTVTQEDDRSLVTWQTNSY